MMTELDRILETSFLEFLESSLTKLCKGKISVVFEDLQSRPITENSPIKRVFAEREGFNICQTMIDCQENEKAQLKCLLSDVAGADMARVHQRGYLYRCHRGRGFPNFLFPITIWQREVVGYLYVGQFVFKELKNSERSKFAERLHELSRTGRYVIENPGRFIKGWTEPDFQDFYSDIAEDEELRRRFPYSTFKQLILDQVRNYGVSPEEFFDIIEFIEGLSNYLSTLGNALYTLLSLAEIEHSLSPTLESKYASDIPKLRNDIISVVTRSASANLNVQEVVEEISGKSSQILIDCKEYEDNYLKELVKPYKLGIAKPSEDLQLSILEFYLRHIAFEVFLYSKIRPLVEARTRVDSKYLELVEKGDELAYSSCNILADCGQQFKELTDFVRNLFLRLCRDREVKALIKSRLIPGLRVLFENDIDDSKLSKWLTDNGVTDIKPEDYAEKTMCFFRAFDLFAGDFESLWDALNGVNQSLAHEIGRNVKIELTDLGDLSEYIRVVNKLRADVSRSFYDDKFGTRQCLDLKAYKVWLNSGGLNSIHRAVLNAQWEWLTHRNEEGPIGARLEKELHEKVEKARLRMARFIGAETPDCVVFTHNTTSSIDAVLRAVLRPGDEVLITDLEHDVVSNYKDWFSTNLGVKFKPVSISKDLLQKNDWISDFLNHMTRRTRLVIVSHITFSTGTLLPIHEIVEKCHKVSKSMGQRVFILIDGAHAVGNIKVNIKDVGCDFYAFDGHKWLLGPEGTGILYSKEQYLKPNNAFGVNFLFSTAFMVSPKYAPKKSDGREYELGTADATKIIGLGAAIESRSKLNQREISSWKKHLVQRFLKSLEGTRWKILNSNEANRTAIVCLQIAGDHQNSKTYETVVNQLDKLNIHVRSVEKPPCVRLCFNHYNNEMDVEIAAFHLKALLEGIDVHRGNDEKIKKKIKELIQKTLAPDEKSDLSGKIGLSLFSIPGSGKTTAVSEAIEELYRSGIIKGKIISRAKDILKNPTKEFSSIFDEAWKKENHPAVIFLDEADSLFDARQKAILGIFNDEQTRILKERKKGRMPIVFITAENDPKAIFESVARRLRLIYFPLPDFKTRLKLLNKLARTAKCSSKLLLTQIANLTDGYSMSDLKELWKEIIGEAGGDPITPDHLHAALQKFRAEALDASLLSKYAQFINDLNPILLTGALEEF